MNNDMGYAAGGGMDARVEPPVAAFRRIYAASALLALLLVAAPFLLQDYLLAGLTRGMIYGLAACSVGYLIRHGGMVSFGHAAYFGIGAYVVLIAQLNGLNEALLVWPLAVAVAGLAGLAIGAMSLRTRAVSFIMITLGFAQMIYFLMSGIQEVGAADGMALARRNTIAGLAIERAEIFHLVVLGALIAVLFGLMRLSASPAGLALKALRQDERRLVSLGFDTYRLQLVAFGLSACATGLAGALAANFYLYVSPSFLHWLLSGELLVMAAFGGLTTLTGGLFGALALIVMEGVLSEFTTYWRIVLGPVVVIAVLWLRRGLEPALLQLIGGRNV